MKNLFFIMMAILLINTNYAGEVGEDMGSDCSDQVQQSRFASTGEITSGETNQVPAASTETSTSR
jgi:hypothetical protein